MSAEGLNPFFHFNKRMPRGGGGGGRLGGGLAGEGEAQSPLLGVRLPTLGGVSLSVWEFEQDGAFIQTCKSPPHCPRGGGGAAPESVHRWSGECWSSLSRCESVSF